MKRFISIVLLYTIGVMLFLMLVCSCTVHKNINTSEKMLATKSDSLSIVEQYRKSLTETVTKESIDTTVYTDSSSTWFRPNLLDTEIQTLETSDLIVTFNSENGKGKIKVHQKAKKVPVKFDKETRIKSITGETTKSTAQVKHSLKSKESEKVKIVEKTGLSFPWWVWAIIILLTLAALGRGCYILYKRVKGSGWV